MFQSLLWVLGQQFGKEIPEILAPVFVQFRFGRLDLLNKLIPVLGEEGWESIDKLIDD